MGIMNCQNMRKGNVKQTGFRCKNWMTALVDCEIIEDYPEDPRGPSFLVLGFSEERPIHAVGALRTNPDELLLITVYDPSNSPAVWAEGYRRRKG